MSTRSDYSRLLASFAVIVAASVSRCHENQQSPRDLAELRSPVQQQETALLGRPFSTTQPAFWVATNTALLNAMVTPNSGGTMAWFEWGTNTTYNRATPPVAVNVTSTPVVIRSQISGLQAQTFYHYRVVASNEAGVTYGANKHFGIGKNVWAWGRNESGQTNVPVDLTNVVAINAGGQTSYALRSDGVIKAWGDDTAGQVRLSVDLTNAIAVSAGFRHALALRADGTVAAWGANAYRQCETPTGLSNVIFVTAGSHHSVALTSEGTVFAWGWPYDGVTNVPPHVTNIVAIAAGARNIIALKDSGDVVVWGNNSSGETNIPVNATNVVSIAAGDNHFLALRRDGTVVAWGNNTRGQTSVPSGLTNVTEVAAGNSSLSSLALKEDVSLVVWGLNDLSRSISFASLVSASGGYYHTLALGLFDLPLATTGAPHDVSSHSAILTGSVDLKGLEGSTYFEYGPEFPHSWWYTETVPIPPNSAGTPITANITGLLAGENYRFRIHASNQGGTVAGDYSVFTTPVPRPRVASFGFISNGVYRLSFYGLSNLTYSVWASTNLTSWVYVGQARQHSSETFEFVEQIGTEMDRRFYRLRFP